MIIRKILIKNYEKNYCNKINYDNHDNFSKYCNDHYDDKIYDINDYK